MEEKKQAMNEGVLKDDALDQIAGGFSDSTADSTITRCDPGCRYGDEEEWLKAMRPAPPEDVEVVQSIF